MPRPGSRSFVPPESSPSWTSPSQGCTSSACRCSQVCSDCLPRSRRRSRRRSDSARDRRPIGFSLGSPCLASCRTWPARDRCCASWTTRSGSTACRLRRWPSWPGDCKPSPSCCCSPPEQRRSMSWPAFRPSSFAGSLMGTLASCWRPSSLGASTSEYSSGSSRKLKEILWRCSSSHVARLPPSSPGGSLFLTDRRSPVGSRRASGSAFASSPRTRSGFLHSQRPTHWVIRRCFGGRRRCWDFRPRRPLPQSPTACWSSASASDSGTRSCDPRPIAASLRTFGEMCIALWPMQWTWTRIRNTAPGTGLNLLPSRMRSSPPSWSIRQVGCKHVAGLAAGGAFLESSATLTPDPARRAARALLAAEAKHAAGEPESALALLALAEAQPHNDLQLARGERLRAEIAFTHSVGATLRLFC